ncbi:MAG: hypothetical protein A2X18_07100 [Bacteroidetes bacterium GWF2_40_14]|nr:MAG: hypothetical protein A2X18_07100 [Bacteroidetes bacterium GWF2_40_14]
MKTVFYLITLIIIISCRNAEADKYDKYLTYKWGNDSLVVIENGFFHSKTHYDSILNKMVGDTLIPIKRIDSMLIITQIVAKGKWELIDDRHIFFPSSDTLITDTVLFKFRNLFGSKLFLFNKKGEYLQFYTLLEKQNDVILENFDDRIKFEIKGFTIGDTISRELVEIEDIHNYETYTIEKSVLKSNKNIEIDIIGDSIIYSIAQREISDSEADDIKLVVKNKLSSEPEYIPKDIKDDYEFEYYYWNKFEITIQLQKMTYKGNNFYSLLNTKVNNWALYYSDRFIENILINEFKNKTPKSLIVK